MGVKFKETAADYMFIVSQKSPTKSKSSRAAAAKPEIILKKTLKKHDLQKQLPSAQHVTQRLNIDT